MEMREDVAFFQIVQTMFRKYFTSGRTGAELNLALLATGINALGDCSGRCDRHLPDRPNLWTRRVHAVGGIPERSPPIAT